MKKYTKLLDIFEKIVNVTLIVYFAFSLLLFLLCAFLSFISPVAYQLNNPSTYSKDIFDTLMNSRVYLWDGMVVPLHELLLKFRKIVYYTVFVFSLLKLSEKPQFRTLMLFEACYLSMITCIKYAPNFFNGNFDYLVVDVGLVHLFTVRSLIFFTPLFLFVFALRIIKDIYLKIKSKKASL